MVNKMSYPADFKTIPVLFAIRGVKVNLIVFSFQISESENAL